MLQNMNGSDQNIGNCAHTERKSGSNQNGAVPAKRNNCSKQKKTVYPSSISSVDSAIQTVVDKCNPLLDVMVPFMISVCNGYNKETTRRHINAILNDTDKLLSIARPVLYVVVAGVLHSDRTFTEHIPLLKQLRGGVSNLECFSPDNLRHLRNPKLECLKSIINLKYADKLIAANQPMQGETTFQFGETLFAPNSIFSRDEDTKQYERIVMDTLLLMFAFFRKSFVANDNTQTDKEYDDACSLMTKWGSAYTSAINMKLTRCVRLDPDYVESERTETMLMSLKTGHIDRDAFCKTLTAANSMLAKLTRIEEKQNTNMSDDEKKTQKREIITQVDDMISCVVVCLLSYHKHITRPVVGWMNDKVRNNRKNMEHKKTLRLINHVLLHPVLNNIVLYLLVEKLVMNRSNDGYAQSFSYILGSIAAHAQDEEHKTPDEKHKTTAPPVPPVVVSVRLDPPVVGI